jgi:arylsulfatase A-like enzyme
VRREEPTRPNVVLINCDDLGYGDLGCYGSTRNDTPAIDRLADEGVRCTSFYMASPVCSPSRAALLTGCYPPRISFGSFEGLPVLFPGQPLGLPRSEISLARVLSDAGYRTQMIGKWHCGDQPGFLPVNHGFDHYFGLPYSNDMGRQANPPALLSSLPPLPLLADDEVIEQQPDQRSLTGRYVAEARSFLRDARDGPFFLYLAHMYVHLPIYVQPEFLERSRNGPYGAAVESIDWATSVLLDELDALGLDGHTIVIFTSDNGSLGDVPPPWGSSGPIGGSNLPLRGAKGSTWEGGMRVPAIVRWTGTLEGGRVCDELLTSMDLYPTLAGLCGAEVPPDRVIDGLDVSEVWRSPTARSPHETFAYYRGNDLEAVRDVRYKLHLSRGGREVTELFDLTDDPGETTDVHGSHPPVVERLRAAADGYRRELGDGRLGIEGGGVRPIGRVERPSTLTTYDPGHPYFAAEYDLDDRG